MKKILSISLVCMVLLGSIITAGAAEDGNILANPGFEGEFKLEDWVNEACEMKMVDEGNDGVKPRSGSFSMQVSGRQNANGTVRHPVAIEYNTPYYVSLWMKLPDGAAPASFMIGFDGAWCFLNETTAVVADRWTKLEGIVKWAETAGTTSVAMRINQNDGGVTPVFYTDDWYMAPITDKQAADFVAGSVTAKTMGIENINCVTGNLKFPAENTEAGAKLSWESGNKTVISDAGAVTRDGEDHNVTLTVTAKVGAETSEKSFQVFVPALSNLIGNGSFDNWNDNPPPNVGPQYGSNWALKMGEPQNAHSGDTYLEINGITAAYAGMRSKFVLENNVPYHISIWLKLPSDAAATDFQLYFMHPTDGWLPAGETVTVGGEWTNLAATYICKGAVGESTELEFWPHQMSTTVTPVYYADDWFVGKASASIEGAKFYSAGNSPSYQNDDGVTELTAAAAGEIAANILVRNGENTEKNMTMLLAAYDENDRLAQVSVIPADIPALAEKVAYGTVFCGGDNYTVKAFLWDSVGGCKPLVAAEKLGAE